MLLQTCWFNGEAGKSLNIAHVRSLMHKLRWALISARSVAESPVRGESQQGPWCIAAVSHSSLSTAYVQLLLHQLKRSPG